MPTWILVRATLLAFCLQLALVSADEQLAPASESVTSIFDSSDGITASGVVLAVVALVVGAMLALLGYQLFHMTLFVIGFIVGGVVCALVVENIFENESWVITVSWIAYIIGGIICGFIASCLYLPGVFLVGALAGAMLAVLLNTSVTYKISPDHPGTVLLVLAIVLGIVGGILAVRFERPVLILATSFAGAWLIMWGVGFFAGGYPSFNDLSSVRSKGEDGDTHYSIPSGWWTYVAGTIAVFAIGAFIQFRCTARGHHHSRRRGRRTPGATSPPRRHRGWPFRAHGENDQPRRNRGWPFRSQAVPRSDEQEQYAGAVTPDANNRRDAGGVV